MAESNIEGAEHSIGGGGGDGHPKSIQIDTSDYMGGMISDIYRGEIRDGHLPFGPSVCGPKICQYKYSRDWVTI